MSAEIVRLRPKARPSADDDVAARLSHPDYAIGYLEAELMTCRRELAWVASALDEGPARRLLVDRRASVDRTLGLLARRR